jgi:hypothetical protein
LLFQNIWTLPNLQRTFRYLYVMVLSCLLIKWHYVWRQFRDLMWNICVSPFRTFQEYVHNSVW